MKNQAKFYPNHKNYDDFLDSHELRVIRNTADVRKIDSMYRTLDKKLGMPMDTKWEQDPTWKLSDEDAKKWEAVSEDN